MSMSYLDQFKKHITKHDYPLFLSLWEEYCLGDEVDGEELKKILLAAKNSEFATSFGRHVEKGLILWEKIKETEIGHEIFKLILDIQTTDDPELADLTFNYLEERYQKDPHFNEKIRLIGLREKKHFQSAVSNYELLTHMKKGNFVFHNAGWGVGEIVDISFLREQLSLEFDYVAGVKDLSFQNAFKTLTTLPHDHFLALRFGNPDELEAKAKKNPIEIIHLLLRDLGPLTAGEIKDELCELVIPNEEWTRWWQTARAKLKKDTLVDNPPDLQHPFQLRETKVAHEEQLKKNLEKQPDANTFIQMVYCFLRDFPSTLKNKEFKLELEEKLQEALRSKEISSDQELQIFFFLTDLKGVKEYHPANDLIKRLSAPEDVINTIDIVAFKKRALAEVRKSRTDWIEIFLNLFLTINQNSLLDYIFKELYENKQEPAIVNKLEELLAHPIRYPEVLLWYFQKIMKTSSLPFGTQEGKNRFFESFFILLSLLEQTTGHRDLIKKMLTFITSARYSNVRKIFQKADKSAVQEFLLLATKCQSFNDHDIKILHSLAEVVHPSLAKFGKKYEGEKEEEDNTIWTTQEGYVKIKNRLTQISTTEIVENAKEIEIARAHGDLRENAEFKAALERKSRLQNELKALSDQFNNTRILTRKDISVDHIGVGTVVDLEDEEDNTITFIILGPFEADPEKHIISFQSKIAQSLMGKKVGDMLPIKGKQCTICKLRNYFDAI